MKKIDSFILMLVLTTLWAVFMSWLKTLSFLQHDGILAWLFFTLICGSWLIGTYISKLTYKKGKIC